MTTYQITDRATGHHWGYYEGQSPSEALDALGRNNLGYGDFAEWCRVSGERAANLRVTHRVVSPGVGEGYGERAG